MGATECFAAAKAGRKQRAQDLVAAEAAITEGQEALTNARREVRNFPAHIKATVKHLERAQLQLERFCSGPQAAYERAFGAPSMRLKRSTTGDAAENTCGENSVENTAACETDIDED